MSDYIDGYVFPIPRACLQEYQALATAIAAIWIEHGALDYREYCADGTGADIARAFPDVLEATDDEVTVFGWMAFATQEMRDIAHEKVATDPRVADLIAASNAGFDAGRMVYGGFQTLVSASGSERA